MKKLLFKVLSVAFILSAITLQNSFAQTEDDNYDFTIDTDWSGAGSSNDPFIISSAEELAGLSYNVNVGQNSYATKYFQLNSTIQLNDSIDIIRWRTWGEDGTGLKNWQPIGTSSHPFNGTFDGNGYTIQGMYVHKTSTAYAGLFGYVGGTSSITNLGIMYSTVYCSGSGALRAGGLVGQQSGGSISNCFNCGYVTGKGSGGYNPAIGGIVGYTAGPWLTATIPAKLPVLQQQIMPLFG